MSTYFETDHKCRLTRRSRLISLVVVVVIVQGLLIQFANAMVIYKDATNPDGVPDLPQGQTCICSRAAWANSLWFLDGRKEGGKYKWPNIVKNTDESDRNKNWRDDGIALRDELAKRWDLTEEEKAGLQRQRDEIAQARKENRRPKRVFRLNRRLGEYAVLDYLKDKGYADQFDMKNFTAGAKVDSKKGNYENYKKEVEKSEDVVLYLRFYDSDDKPITDANGQPIGHAVTAAGLDSEKKKLIVSNPHGDHPASGPAVDSSFYDEYDIKDLDETGGEMRITDRDLFNFAGIDNSKIAYGKVEFFKALSPKAEEPKQKIEDTARVKPNPGEIEYTYTVTNNDVSPIQSVFLSLEAPVFDVFSPTGWEYFLTGNYAPDHFGDPDWFINVDGVYWYTDSIGILPGEVLSGFGFSALDIYPHQEYAALATLGDGRNIQFPQQWGLHDGPVNVEEGSYLYQVFTSGPGRRIPEPSSLAVFALGLAAVCFSRLLSPAISRR